MMSNRLDIPLNRDGSVRFLPWLTAVMVYLAGLALAGTLMLNGALARWDRSLAGTLTVELPPLPAEGGKGDDSLAAALETLRLTPGVSRAEPLSREATARLIEPWLGTSLTPEELALPRLVDLRVDPDRPPDLAQLKMRLDKAAPGAVLDDHRQWIDRWTALLLSIEITTLTILGLVAVAAVLTVVFTTRTGLAIHHSVIEVLHLIGARDGYIAGQFERQALRLGLRGGIIGLALAAATLFGIAHAAAAAPLLGERIGLFPSLALASWHWLVLALLPFAAALIAMITARITVLRALARMP
jgi:cell division transport system permease protein